MLRLPLAGILVVLGASCGGRALRSGRDAAANLPDSIVAGDTAVPDLSFEAARGETLNADGAALSIDVAAADSADAPAGDAVDGGPACVAYPVAPPDTPSRQTVRFHFASSSPDYLVARGWECLPFSLGRYGEPATPVIIDSYALTLCEGPAPPAPGAASAVALNQPGVVVLTWDGRVLEPHQACVDCGARGWTGAPSYPLTLFSRVPVAPGRYHATFAVLGALPSVCLASVDRTTATCTATYGAYGQRPPQISLCPSSRSLSVDFELPATGDVDVTVTDTL